MYYEVQRLQIEGLSHSAIAAGLEGIKLAKIKGAYKGRITGSNEDALTFLSKKRTKEALAYLRKGGLKSVEISKLTGLHINTITKNKKVGYRCEFCQNVF